MLYSILLASPSIVNVTFISSSIASTFKLVIFTNVPSPSVSPPTIEKSVT